MSRSNDVQPSVAELARVIARTLETYVIPELPRSSWSSGYLHSALVLLAHIEARSAGERPMLVEEGAQLTALLSEARGLAAATPEARELLAEIDAALGLPAPALATAEAAELDARNTALARALNSLIVWTYAHKAAAASAYAPRLLELFAGYRTAAAARGVALLGDAVGKPIF